jgi:hypothetical protein
MKMDLSKVFGVFWVILGIGVLLTTVIDGVALFRSEFADNARIRTSVLLGIPVGVAAVVLGVNIAARPLWVRLLGYGLCAILILYTLFIMAITPTQSLIRPFLLVQVYVLVLCTWTIIILARTSTAQEPSPSA